MSYESKKKKKKGQADRYVAEEKIGCKFRTRQKVSTHSYTHKGFVFLDMCLVQVNKDQPSAEGQHDCASGTSCPRSTVALEDVLASDVYSCATLDYIQSDLLKYLK